ncbi:ribosome alternative rescue factor ArfA [Paraglaciecola aquimarina]|uniref:Ribosome alternative rescue factor ArfA n=1 Tax=Paraglaciecola aquimarina TaxID=1235557 RepID=A0ABU3SX66_9ALTE|nr:ribosome alternative rescue factor ArfA [Paraglaciecola aquimarina]MDU0354572.1 ribosome alternative rescue factor ArfA [Paraglaciecola aquimarina]
MRKNNKQKVPNNAAETELGRGAIRDNFLAALVTSKVYKMQIVKAKKGKGSYQRKAKNIRQESYLIAA